jgi:phosphatidate cytidylyltransferase
MKNFLLRSLTGSVYVVLVVAGVIVNSSAFVALFSLVVILCLQEFYGLINVSKRASVNPYFHCFGGLVLFATGYFYASGILGKLILVPYLIYIVISLISELYRKNQDPLMNLAYTLLGQCYIALPLSVLCSLAFGVDDSGIHYSQTPVLALFVFIWVNDTGAYLVGITLGKRRLFERISPKKSWEGFFGGLVFTTLSSLVFFHYEQGIPYYHWIGLAVTVVVFGTWGDLIESHLKRTLDVKDSGRSLPGHGGFLDRFDSLLFAIYGMFFYFRLIL